MSHETLKNDDGYMTDPSNWTLEYAKWRADDLGIEMTEQHWDIVALFREFIEDHSITPSSRIAQKEAKKRFSLDSKGFYRLFPNGPKQAAMVSGGIKPSGC
jgi:TusE/DsrC/DsvC family sulfur relay protein